ncbi:MAG: Bro-N domain-containing protein [Methylomicrobium sp.]|nr:Bro-N domain-containing protein [Methylomicrobium sp.]
MNTISLSFRETQFDVVDLNNQPWLRGTQIGDAFGYKKAGRISIDKLYKANADEFTDSMTALVELDTEGGKQKVRIFSLRGCHLLAMFARTEVAKEFRKWVLDILENHSSAQYALKQLPEPKTKKALPGGLTLDQQDCIKALVRGRIEKLPKEKQGGAAIRIWSSIKAKFGKPYKEIAPDQFAEVCSLIGRLEVSGEPLLQVTPLELDALVDLRVKKALEGELLNAPCPKYHAPLSLWQPDNRVGATAWLTYPELTRMEQSARPLTVLLQQLRQDGHDVQGATAEYQAL